MLDQVSGIVQNEVTQRDTRTVQSGLCSGGASAPRKLTENSTYRPSAASQPTAAGARINCPRLIAFNMAAGNDPVNVVDVRSACVHEFAHHVVAKHYGVVALVSFYENPGAAKHERTYCGKVQFLPTPPDGAIGRRIALAGVIAECRNYNEEVTAEEIAQDLEDGFLEMSASDLALAEGYALSDIEESLKVINQNWQFILDATSAHVSTRAI